LICFIASCEPPMAIEHVLAPSMIDQALAAAA
jgi:hypothetical protein